MNYNACHNYILYISILYKTILCNITLHKPALLISISTVSTVKLVDKYLNTSNIR